MFILSNKTWGEGTNSLWVKQSQQHVEWSHNQATKAQDVHDHVKSYFDCQQVMLLALQGHQISCFLFCFLTGPAGILCLARLH